MNLWCVMLSSFRYLHPVEREILEKRDPIELKFILGNFKTMDDHIIHVIDNALSDKVNKETPYTYYRDDYE